VKRIGGALLLAAISLAVSLLAVEAFWRLFPDTIPRGIEVLARARVYRFDPGVGIVLRPGVDRRVTIPLLDRTVRVRTEAYGRPVGFRDDGLQGGARVAILGDSYTFGYGVDQDESFPAQLEERLRARGRAVDVINAGVPGFGAREERRMLEKHVLPLGPALVLVAVYENDLRDNERSEHRRFHRLRDFLGVHSIVYELLSAARATHPRLQAEVRKKALPEERAGDRTEEGYRIEREELARMRDQCARRGVRFGLILLPGKPPLEMDRLRPPGPGVPVLDLKPRFAEVPRKTWRNRYIGHLTPEANGWVADTIADFIDRNELLAAGPGAL